MKTKLQAVLFGLAIAWSAGATATSFNTASGGTAPTSTLINTGGGTPAPAPLYCNATGCYTAAPSGTYVTLTAWSTPGPAAASGSSPTDNRGTWLSAYLAIYGSNGIGISNTQEGTGATVANPETLAQLTCGTGCPTSNPEHVGSAPQHAIDNRGVDDILVVDFGSSGWDVNSFSLGYTCNTNGACGGAVAVEAWVGTASGVNKDASINFASENFSANNNINAVPTVGTFTRLALINDPLTGGVVSDPGSVTGRYLIITGALGPGTATDLGTGVTGYSDAFKVSGIVATKTGPGPSAVPAPGSLPLVALGLLALTIVARRRLVTA